MTSPMKRALRVRYPSKRPQKQRKRPRYKPDQCWLLCDRNIDKTLDCCHKSMDD